MNEFGIEVVLFVKEDVELASKSAEVRAR